MMSINKQPLAVIDGMSGHVLDIGVGLVDDFCH